MSEYSSSSVPVNWFVNVEGKPIKKFDLTFSIDDFPFNVKLPAKEMLNLVAKTIVESKKEEFQPHLRSFAITKTLEFVFNANLGEKVGYQTKFETFTILQKFYEDNSITATTKEDMETLNTHKALNYLQNVRCEMLEMLNNDEKHHSIYLDEEIIRECHSHLIEGLISNKNNGEYIASFTNNDLVKNHCNGLIEYYNTIVQTLDVNDLEKLFKLAAHLAFNFGEMHPFSDGNGRMCRLLVNYVMSLVLPFPVSFGCSDAKNPKELTCLLLENAYQSCIDFGNSYNRDMHVKIQSFSAVSDISSGFELSTEELEILSKLNPGDTFGTRNYQFVKTHVDSLKNKFKHLKSKKKQ